MGLPPEPLPALISNPVGLENVFNNLVANAINYSDDGGRIEVKARLDDGRLRVEVSDQGFSIEEKKQAMIFDKFYQGKNEKIRFVTGTSLGLPLVKSVVECPCAAA
ncbi:hypothetical protein DFAR_3990018 [Desulfarculales bacterium]